MGLPFQEKTHSVLLSNSDLSTAVQLLVLGQVLNILWKHLFWVKQYIVQLHPAALLLFFPMAQTGHMVSFLDNFLRNGYSLKWPVWRSYPLESSCTAFTAISSLTEARILFCCFQGYTWLVDFLHFPWLLYWPLINELKIPPLCHSEVWSISIKRSRYFLLFFNTTSYISFYFHSTDISHSSRNAPQLNFLFQFHIYCVRILLSVYLYDI